MFSEEAIWNYIFNNECNGNITCASRMYSSWQNDTQWWEGLLSASANDILMTVNPFAEEPTMSFFSFQGEGQDLLTGMAPTNNPFAIEDASVLQQLIPISAIWCNSMGIYAAVANKDFRGNFTAMHGLHDYSVRLRTIDSQLADGYSILWNVIVAMAFLPVAPENSAMLVLVELGGAVGAEKAYSAISRTAPVKEGDQTLMVSYGGPYGAVFAEVSGRYGATYGWCIQWYSPNGNR